MTAPQTNAPAIPCVTWRRVFPALPAQVGAARRFLAGILGDCPQTADAVLCLSEIAANAVQHSRSAEPGGRFAVRVSRAPGWLRVEVTDGGGPWAARSAREGHGRGLAIATALTDRLQVSDLGADSPARTVAFEMRLG